MTEPPVWDGTGLPPGALARIERARTDRVRTSLSAIGGQAALVTDTMGDAALEPVGEVMGGIVEHFGFAGWGGCGVYYGGLGGWSNWGSAPTRTSGSAAGLSGYKPYVDALYRGWNTSLRRMLLEAQALGADGIVDVRWTWKRLDEAGNREFVALGTAVRSRSSLRPRAIFATDLSAADVSKLLSAGHIPAGLAVGISVSIRHDDWATRRQAASYSSWNTEVGGYTELVNYCRHDARHQFERRVAQYGADVAIVSAMGLHIWALEPSEGHRDHVAEATVVGTGLVSSPTAHDPQLTDRALTVMPLR